MNLKKMLKQSLVSSHLLKMWYKLTLVQSKCTKSGTPLSMPLLTPVQSSHMKACKDAIPSNVLHVVAKSLYTASWTSRMLHPLVTCENMSWNARVKSPTKLWCRKILSRLPAPQWVSFQGLGQLQPLSKGRAREKWLTVTASIPRLRPSKWNLSKIWS